VSREAGVVDLDVAGLALLPVTAAVDGAATRAASRALGPGKLYGGPRVAPARRRRGLR
jgi:hypothetical protein